MSEEEYLFFLNDRLQKIQSINSSYDLENKLYISFSGGKDSTVLSCLVDIALPGNNIPRGYINTGIEYKAVVDFVKESMLADKRITIISPHKNILEVLRNNGYPFKSKEHSQKVALFQKSGMIKTVRDYLGLGKKKTFLCPHNLKYQFRDSFGLKLSDKCCFELKKKPAAEWSELNGKPVTITGIRQSEKGLRSSMQGCTVFYDKDCKSLHKFHPLFPLTEEWIDEFIKRNNIRLCKLYYPPYNFERTGCKGCPFNLNLQDALEVMENFFPAERKQCEMIWKPVYDEYRKIGFRLSPQLEFDF